jgi:Zn-dependent protease/CBS domain-containing protein
MFKGSMRLGTLLGIPIFVHWSFLVLIAWFMAGPLLSGEAGATRAALTTGGFVLSIFACVVLHEMGHALAARRYGIKTRDITLLPIGGVARLDRMPDKPMQELVVAVAGPMVNVVLAAVIVPAVLATQGVDAFLPEPGAAGRTHAHAIYQGNFLAALGATNVALVVFNMIPAFPMDGGRVLRALLAMITDRAKATAIAATVGRLSAVGFAILGVFTGNLVLVLIAGFVFLGAGAEVEAEQVKSALRGLPMRAAMMTRFVTLRDSQTLREAAEELLAGSQQDFPVLSAAARNDKDAAALVGVLTRMDLVRGMAAGKMDDAVSTLMRPGCLVASEDDDLQSVLDQARSLESSQAMPPSASAIAVVRTAPGRADEATIVGLVTMDNVAEVVMLRSAGDRPRAGKPR